MNFRIKCINLERRLDRKNKTISLLNDLNLLNDCDFFSAVDGLELKTTDDIINMFSGNDFCNRKTVIGCALSHYYLWCELLKNTKYDSYLIIEDDVIFCDNFKSMLNDTISKLENINWDIVYLGYSIRKTDIDYYNQNYNSQKDLVLLPHLSNISIGGFFGYIINKNGTKKIVDFIEKNGIKHGIDYLVNNYKNEMQLNDYETIPRLIFSDFVPEDISASKAISGNIDSDIQYNYESLF